ncbi:acyltransferase [Alkalibacter mobilis]|uniref:acyltransferase n=1 Tax=Alkalibacter mobilis TaxID=2787712 RepID=UPI00189F2DAE|nr:acyltransferase [Alkalibacter mobilis]MBF7097822.1 acyltransferase [Alkalibacter mobilis]
MTILEKLFKGIKKPHIAFQVVNIIMKNYRIRLKYKVLNKKIIISKSVRFYQNTVLSGKGTIVLNDEVSIGYKLGGNYHNRVSELQARYDKSIIMVHSNTAINNSNFIVAANKIEIGSYCRIGANVTMMDFEAHGTHPEKRNLVGEFGEILIGRNVWIGNNVIILKNVRVGDNCIIAAGSVVLKGDYPSNSIIGGNPAKVVKQINEVKQ